ncbi:MAG TPA: hypothetical protein VGF48_15155 [Thermoanaerobaculia bacterium]
MLAEHQVRFLLEHCEAILGQELKQLRGNLRSKRHVRAAIWELILIDAAAELGSVKYEPATPSGKALDIFLDVDGGLWIEAAFLEPRFAEVLERQETFTQRLRKTEKEAGIPVGSIQRDFYGGKSAAGFDVTVAHESALARVFRSPEMRAFLADIKAQPSEHRRIDLGAAGVTVVLTYVGPRSGPTFSVGGSPVPEAPRSVEEHALFRLLDEKGRKYRKAGITHPVVIHVATERNPSVSRFYSVHTVPHRDAVAAALRKHPIISGVVLMWLESPVPMFGLAPPRQPRLEAFVNDDAPHPLTERMRAVLPRMRFDRVDYGELWNEWEGATTAEQRLDRLGGSMSYRGTKDGFAVTIPADLLIQALGSTSSTNLIDSEYRVDGSKNPFRRARSEGRPVVGITLLPHEKRLRDPQMVEIEFGAPTSLLLQAKR